MKKCFISIRTTGLLSYKHGIYELSALIEDNDKVIDACNLFMNPGDVLYDQYCTDMLNASKEKIEQYESQDKVFSSFLEFLDKYKTNNEKFFIVGYNVGFITDFLKNWFKKNSEEDIYSNKISNIFFDYFLLPGLDLMQLANFLLLPVREKMTDFKFNTVCDAFEIPPIKSSENSAFVGVRHAYILYKKLMNNN